MILSREQILCYFIFILCISLITFYYINSYKNKNNNNKLYENFVNSNSNYLNLFDDTEIPNITLKNAINSKIPIIKKFLNNYSMLDPGINVNNKSVLCDNLPSNNCTIKSTATSNDASCLSGNIPTSCSYFFNKYVKTLANINLNSIGTRENIIRNASQLMNDIDAKFIEVNTILDILVNKINLQAQQNTFITYNITNLNDKTKLVDKTTEEYEKNENDININQINFTNFLSMNNKNVNKVNLYYYAIISIVILIIIVGIFNIFMSNID
jgi:hypothetical protein